MHCRPSSHSPPSQPPAPPPRLVRADTQPSVAPATDALGPSPCCCCCCCCRSPAGPLSPPLLLPAAVFVPAAAASAASTAEEKALDDSLCSSCTPPTAVWYRSLSPSPAAAPCCPDAPALPAAPLLLPGACPVSAALLKLPPLLLLSWPPPGPPAPAAAGADEEGLLLPNRKGLNRNRLKPEAAGGRPEVRDSWRDMGWLLVAPGSARGAAPSSQVTL
jgi:hypothetical protein